MSSAGIMKIVNFCLVVITKYCNKGVLHFMRMLNGGNNIVNIQKQMTFVNRDDLGRF